MTAILLGGQHSHEHLQVPEGVAETETPQHIRVQSSSQRGSKVSIYQFVSSESSDGSKVYQFVYAKHGNLDGLVEFGQT